MSAVASADTLDLLPQAKRVSCTRVESTIQYRRDVDAEFSLMLEESLRNEDASTLQRFTDPNEFRRFLEGE